MRNSRDLLLKTLVRPFYKQNAGLFAFLLFFMFAAVGRANGVGLLEYHLSLIQGIMTNTPFMIFTLTVWFLYALKCSQFVTGRLATREYGFLSLLSLTKPARLFGRLMGIQFILLLPIVLYAMIAIWIGVRHHWWQHMALIALFFLFMILAGARWYQYLLNHPGRQGIFRVVLFSSLSMHSGYWLFLWRYVWTSRRWLFLFIKIFGCLVIYGLIVSLPPDDHDLRMVILFYCFGLLGHGILIYAIRDMEEREMTFYRALPVSILNRFLQYTLFYVVLFIPEMVTIGSLTPGHIGFSTAFILIFFGFSVILFLNALLFIRFFRKSENLKIVTGLYLTIFIALLSGIFPILVLILFLLSVYLFVKSYYQFEKIVQE